MPPGSHELCDAVESATTNPVSTGSSVGRILAASLGISALAISAISLPFVLPGFRRICLPFIPATSNQLNNVFRLLPRTRNGGNRLVDLGSGDGRVVIEAAKLGFKATGIELNSILVIYSKFTALRSGLRSFARFHRGDMFKTDLTQFDHVVVFGVDSLMPPLAKKMSRELRDDASVVACRFPFANMEPDAEILDASGVDSVWRYRGSQFRSQVGQKGLARGQGQG